MKRILVTGAGGNAAQNFIASLRMADDAYYVVGTDTNPFHLDGADVQARYVIPRCDADDYLAVLLDIVRREQVQLVHPQPDVEVAFLAQHRDVFSTGMFLPRADVIRCCQDKMACHEVLEAAGVPVPASLLVPDAAHLPSLFDLLQVSDEALWLRAVRGAGSKAALPVRTSAQAEGWIRYWQENKGLAFGDFMLAAYLPGREFAFQSLWHEGQLVTSMARERMEYLFGSLRASGQSSSPAVARTVHRDDVNDVATRAIQAVDARPHGVYCVDLKGDAAGQPCVMEINAGRFFTTSNFFSAAGSNMPDDYVRLAFGERLPQRPRYNALPPELYWVRGVDREPRLLRGLPWTARRVA